MAKPLKAGHGLESFALTRGSHWHRGRRDFRAALAIEPSTDVTSVQGQRGVILRPAEGLLQAEPRRKGRGGMPLGAEVLGEQPVLRTV